MRTAQRGSALCYSPLPKKQKSPRQVPPSALPHSFTLVGHPQVFCIRPVLVFSYLLLPGEDRSSGSVQADPSCCCFHCPPTETTRPVPVRLSRLRRLAQPHFSRLCNICILHFFVVVCDNWPNCIFTNTKGHREIMAMGLHVHGTKCHVWNKYIDGDACE